MNFEKCLSFWKYEPQVGKLNEKAARSKSNMPLDKSVSSLCSMVNKGSIFAIRADNAITNYFILICESEVIEHLDNEKPHNDDAGQVIYYGTKYITGKYLRGFQLQQQISWIQDPAQNNCSHWRNCILRTSTDSLYF